MHNMPHLSLRQWRDDDLEPYVAMNQDPEVMRHFPALLTREQTAAALARQRDLIAQQGWGLWALEVEGEFAGFTGLAVPRFQAAFMPCVEVGWRLRRKFWGQGVAFRAAQQALRHGFGPLGLREIVSFTATTNLRSRRLMERLGFTHDQADDFDHPSIALDHPLRRHVLYRKAVSSFIPIPHP